MKKTFALIAVAGLAAIANAQPIGTGNISYEVSADNGTTWQTGTIEVLPTQASVLFRARATWSADGGMYAFAGAQFDAVVSNAGAGDSAANATRPGTTGTGSAQTLVASRFGNQIKIDDSRDTAAPGQGARGVFPGQLVQNFTTSFSTANPLVIFQFQLNLDGTEGTRSVSNLYVPPSGGNSTDRFMRVYTSAGGAQNNPLSSSTGAAVNVLIPTPGALALMGMGLVGVGRRRR
jgi:MYXO-CTERM domain-containing protein